MMPKIPTFTVSQTLMGFGGGANRNRLTLHGPNSFEVELVPMGIERDPRIDAQMNAMAILLTKLWDAQFSKHLDTDLPGT